jgi:hypothetical protein
MSIASLLVFQYAFQNFRLQLRLEARGVTRLKPVNIWHSSLMTIFISLKGFAMDSSISPIYSADQPYISTDSVFAEAAQFQLMKDILLLETEKETLQYKTKNSQAELVRYKKLYEHKAVSEEEVRNVAHAFEMGQCEMAVLDARIEQVHQQVTTAQLKLLEAGNNKDASVEITDSLGRSLKYSRQLAANLLACSIIELDYMTWRLSTHEKLLAKSAISEEAYEKVKLDKSISELKMASFSQHVSLLDTAIEANRRAQERLAER